MQVVAARLTSPLGLTEVPYNWLGCSQVNLKGEGRGLGSVKDVFGFEIYTI